MRDFDALEILPAECLCFVLFTFVKQRRPIKVIMIEAVSSSVDTVAALEAANAVSQGALRCV